MVVRRETLVQLSDELLDVLDRRARELNTSRSALIRQAIERFLADAVSDDIDRRIVEGYTKFPQEDIWGDAPLRALIQAEPW
jgi:metal-responsive CopG/Arc/MetJ family transcriptional regulator